MAQPDPNGEFIPLVVAGYVAIMAAKNFNENLAFNSSTYLIRNRNNLQNFDAMDAWITVGYESLEDTRVDMANPSGYIPGAKEYKKALKVAKYPWAARYLRGVNKLQGWFYRGLKLWDAIENPTSRAPGSNYYLNRASVGKGGFDQASYDLVVNGER